MEALRERIALRIAPWLHVPNREDREEAFRDLAVVAYGSRNAVWTSPRVLAKAAMDYCYNAGVNGKRPTATTSSGESAATEKGL